MSRKPILVTRPVLPPIAEVVTYLERIWEARILTNSGPLHCELEDALADYLGVEHLSLFSNGMLALMTAIRALDLTGEVITTPYSFVATAHAISWNGLVPVFVDVDPRTLNIDPRKIEAACSPRTTAILPVHCYGNPCDTDAIQSVAERLGLRVVHDAAHAFGVRDSGGSVLRHGDISILSFHATKVFNTFEGGAVICRDRATKERVDRLRNFGIKSETEVLDVGLNGKMNEFQAAIGLLQLDRVDECITARSRVDARYRSALKDLSGVSCLPLAGQARHNYSYFPILVDERYKMSRDDLYEKLGEMGIKARRYFYPLISEFPMYRDHPSAASQALPIACNAASRVLCLPIYPELEMDEVDRICNAIAWG